MPNSKASAAEYQLINVSDIKIIENLGRGSYGTVHKARWKNEVVAVKQFDSNCGKKELEKEVTPLLQIKSHPNIIRFCGAAMEGCKAFLVMEFAAGGSLDKFIHFPPRRNYTKGDAINFALQCANGVSYLHKKNFLHRDLKPANLLLLKDFRVLKICDFGTVADLKSEMTANRGTIQWMAPEVSKGSKYTEKCDVYSWSIILWELFSRQYPFDDIAHGAIQYQVAEKNKRPEPVTQCPQEIWELMETCWHKDVSQRYSMEEIVEHVTDFSRSFAERDDLITGISEEGRHESTTLTDINWGGGTLGDDNNTSAILETNNETIIFDGLLPNEVMMNGSKIKKVEQLSSANGKSMEDFELGKFGICFKAKWENKTVVVKTYSKAFYRLGYGDKIETLLAVKRHKNFIQLFDSYYNNSSPGATYLITEYADGGSLFDFLHKEPRRYYSAAQAVQWLLQLINVLKFLNDQRNKLPIFICHSISYRDIKSDNIFLTNNFQVIKIGYFLSKEEKQHKPEETTYLPAEISGNGVHGTDNNPPGFVEDTVVFFWGILMYEILFREKPDSRLGDTHYRRSLSARCPKFILNLMVDCWKESFYYYYPGRPRDLNGTIQLRSSYRLPIALIVNIMSIISGYFTQNAGWMQRRSKEQGNTSVLESFQEVSRKMDSLLSKLVGD